MKLVPIVVITACLLQFACDTVSYNCVNYPCDPASCSFIEVDCPDSAYYLDAGVDGGSGYNLDDAFDDCTTYEVDTENSSDTKWSVKACARGACFTEDDMSYYICAN